MSQKLSNGTARADCHVCVEALTKEKNELKAQAANRVYDYYPCTGSLPAILCDWAGHEEAVDEAGFCPVCQHDPPSGRRKK